MVRVYWCLVVVLVFLRFYTVVLRRDCLKGYVYFVWSRVSGDYVILVRKVSSFL